MKSYTVGLLGYLLISISLLCIFLGWYQNWPTRRHQRDRCGESEHDIRQRLYDAEQGVPTDDLSKCD